MPTLMLPSDSSRAHFHEALNLAAVWKAPVVFVCENNLYAASTHISHTARIADLSLRAAGYGMPGVTVAVPPKSRSSVRLPAMLSEPAPPISKHHCLQAWLVKTDHRIGAVGGHPVVLGEVTGRRRGVGLDP